MPDKLLKHYAIEIQQKLYEKETPEGVIAVYHTEPFGMILTLDDNVVISEHDGFFYHEMMSHPALFTHPDPKTIAIVGDTFGVLQEVVKHTNVSVITCVNPSSQLDEAINHYFLPSNCNDARIHRLSIDSHDWLNQCDGNSYDVIIQVNQTEDFLEKNFQHYYRILRSDGIFIQPCRTSLMQTKALKPIYQNIKHAGFSDWQLLNFPQPSYPSGWRMVLMATKRPTFNRIREKAIYNRSFSTRYYNFDVHKAALVLPEFMREILTWQF